MCWFSFLAGIGFTALVLAGVGFAATYAAIRVVEGDW